MSHATEKTAEALREMAREERLRQRRSQADVAMAVGLSRKWLSEYELGKVDPSVSAAMRLAAVLGISVSFSGPEDGFGCAGRSEPGHNDVPISPTRESAIRYLESRALLLGHEPPFEGGEAALLDRVAEGAGSLSDPLGFAAVMHGCDAEVDACLRRRGSWLRPEEIVLADMVAETDDPRVRVLVSLSGPDSRYISLLASSGPPRIAAAARGLGKRQGRKPRSFDAGTSLARWHAKMDSVSGRGRLFTSVGGTWNRVLTASGMEEARHSTGRVLKADEEAFAFRKWGAAAGADEGMLQALAVFRRGDLKEILKPKRCRFEVWPELAALAEARRSA